MELRKQSIRLVLTALILFGAIVGIFEYHEAQEAHSALINIQQQDSK